MTCHLAIHWLLTLISNPPPHNHTTTQPHKPHGIDACSVNCTVITTVTLVWSLRIPHHIANLN
eukprot:m.358327 g.358327  ORF g.358327 m.358327 type:complete len:63 (-) comp18113_c0_seq1:1940-2128(-)